MLVSLLQEAPGLLRLLPRLEPLRPSTHVNSPVSGFHMTSRRKKRPERNSRKSVRRSCSLHVDVFVRAPQSGLGDRGLGDQPDAHVSVFPCC